MNKAHVVFDGDHPIYCANDAQACHEHINDAINEFHVEGAEKWKVVQMAAESTVQALPFAILPDELEALRRFHECAADGEGYDVTKEMMGRLSEIGLVRRRTGSYYEETIFGLSVLNGDFDAAQTAPVVPQAQEPAVKEQHRDYCQGCCKVHASADCSPEDRGAADARLADDERLAAYRSSNAFAQLDACDKPGALVGFEHACAAIRNTSQTVPQRDREADRARFADPLFNKWLDEAISDAGHTVWDQIGDTAAAWAGWENRPHYSSVDRQRWQNLDFDYNDKDNIRTFHATAYDAGLAAASTPAPINVPSLTEIQREAVCAAITEALGEAYDCLRVWSAWSHDTMGPDDFALVAEDDSRVAEIADAAIKALAAAPASHPAPAQTGEKTK